MAIGASFSGGGFVGPDGFLGGVRIVLISALPIFTITGDLRRKFGGTLHRLFCGADHLGLDHCGQQEDTENCLTRRRQLLICRITGLVSD